MRKVTIAPVITAEPTARMTLVLPVAVLKPFREQVLRREQAGLPYVSAEDLMELWIVDMAARRHPIPNPYGDQVTA